VFQEEHVIYRYKYLPFSEDSLKTISEGTIKFTCPLDFNDPFDCLPYYGTSNIENLLKLRPDLFKAAAKRRGLSPAQRLQQKGEFIARLKKRISDGDFAKDALREVGVVSLSKNGLSVLMWSHYAQLHQGFVLEFRIPIMGSRMDIAYAADRLLPLPVTYQSARPVVDVAKADRTQLLESILLTKSDVWAYEEEERVLSELRSAGIFPYQRDEILCSVIAGMRISDKNFKTLEIACDRVKKNALPNLSLFKAVPLSERYGLYVPGHPRLSLGNT